MAQKHISVYNDKDKGFLQVYVNGCLAGSIRHDQPDYNSILEWLFEVVYCRGFEHGTAAIRRQLNDLLLGNSGSGVTTPDRPPQDLQGFKD